MKDSLNKFVNKFLAIHLIFTINYKDINLLR